MTAPAVPAHSVPAAERADLFQLAALLLTYPDSELLRAGDTLSAAAARIRHPHLRQLLDQFLHWLGTTEPIKVQQHYVQTFDLRRRCGLYLTYYLHGDTRKRGMALLILKQRYRAHGFRLVDGELPDLLPVVLEFAAAVGPGDGEAPLRQHRRGIEVLRAALTDLDTPYRWLLDAVSHVLPELTDADHEAIAALAFDGPPVEAVGMEPYGADLHAPDGAMRAPHPTCHPPEAPR